MSELAYTDASTMLAACPACGAQEVVLTTPDEEVKRNVNERAGQRPEGDQGDASTNTEESLAQ